MASPCGLIVAPTKSPPFLPLSKELSGSAADLGEETVAPPRKIGSNRTMKTLDEFRARFCSSRTHVSALFSALLVVAAPAFNHAAESEPPAGFTSLFNGKDFANWKVPDGDNGHWKVVDGVIDYDAASEASGDKNLWTEREFTDFVLRIDWRIKETPYVNPNVPYILPDGRHAKNVTGKEMKLALLPAKVIRALHAEAFCLDLRARRCR